MSKKTLPSAYSDSWKAEELPKMELREAEFYNGFLKVFKTPKKIIEYIEFTVSSTSNMVVSFTKKKRETNEQH